MRIRVSATDGVPIYHQIANQIKYLVAAGRLEIGERLPAVRRLAEDVLVNPNTVARAYRELEAEGVVESRRGSGVFVSDRASPLARREQNRILQERIDQLLAEAKQLDVDLDVLIKLVHERHRKLG